MGIDLKVAREIVNAMHVGEFKETREGILFSRKGILVAGHYYHRVNGRDLRIDHNLIPDAGILSILNMHFGSAAKIPAWYLALFAGAVNPTAGLTAANFAATMTEITSSTEGYSQATRPQWIPSAAASGGIIGNLTSKAAFTIVCTSSITVEGAALISNNIKGGTSGVLASCGRFAAPRTLFSGDEYELGYTVTLSSD